MTSSMLRRNLTGVALAAWVAVVALAPISSAEAGAGGSPSPFAGSYVGSDPQGRYDSWDVTISDGGRITSSYSLGTHYKGSIHGQVSDDGSYSFTVSVTMIDQIPDWRGKATPVTLRYTVAGTMASDADGNIVGTYDRTSTDTHGGSFFWLRQ